MRFMMNDSVLFVDDEPNILSGYERQLRKQFHIHTASGGDAGLQTIAEKGPFAVVVSDFRMPQMNGIQFLSRVREIAPDTVRMMLTGYAEINAAIGAINEGNVFRFLTKPCDTVDLTNAVFEAIRQYHLIIAERELLEETLRGSVKALVEILGLVNPEAFGRCTRIKNLVKDIARNMSLPDIWQFETAAMLSQIGAVIFSEDIIKKVNAGEELTGEEAQLFEMHPLVGSDLIAKIPRMGEIARIIAYQERHFDGCGVPRDGLVGNAIPVGARILKVVMDFDILETKCLPRTEIMVMLRSRTGRYDPEIVTALDAVLGISSQEQMKSVTVKDLRIGMLLAEDVCSEDGVLLVAKGQQVNDVMIFRLRGYARAEKIKEPFQVKVQTDSTE
jgi:response regulator RpfG family c-di-GMP phosphodiesterase